MAVKISEESGYLGIPAWNQGAHLSRASSSRLVKLSVLTGNVGR